MPPCKRTVEAAVTAAPPWSRTGLSPPPRPTWSQARLLLVLCVLAFGLRWEMLRRTPAIAPAYHPVLAQAYLDVAESFLAGDGWTWNGAPATQHPPGYSLYLAGALRVHRTHGVALARVGQAGLNAAAVVLVWAVARRCGTPMFALAAALAFAVLPEFVFAATPLLADSLMLPWLLGCTYGALRWAESAQARWMAVMGAGAALAMLCRTECLPLAAAVVAWGVLGVRDRRRAWPGVGAGLLMVAVLYGPWHVWQRAAMQGAGAIAVASPNIMLEGLGQRPNRFGLLDSDRYVGAIVDARGFQWQYPEGNALVLGIAKHVLTEDPGVLARAIRIRWRRILTQVNGPWSATDWRRRGNRLVVVLALLAGVWALARGQLNLWAGAVVAAPLLLYVCGLGLLYYEPRYVVPGHVSALWLGAAVSAPRPGGWRRGVVATVLLVCVSGALWLGLERHANRAAVRRLARAAPDSPWRPAEPTSATGAQIAREPNGTITISGGMGTDQQPGFVALWPPLPTVPNAVTSVLVDVEVLAGPVRVALIQTIQFSDQPPEHLWLAQRVLTDAGRYHVALSTANFIGRPITLVMLPAAGRARPTASCRVRVHGVHGWPDRWGPTEPWAVPAVAVRAPAV